MAENELKTQLDNIVAGNEQADDKFLYALAFGGQALEGFNAKDLENVLSLVPDNHPFRENIVARVNEKMSQIKENEGNVAQEEKPETKEAPESKEQTPETKEPEQAEPVSDSPTKADEKTGFEFMAEPSYSQYKGFAKLLSEARKENNNLSNEDIMKMTDIINNAQKYVDLLADKEITPENAVVLKDYINILRDGKTFEADEKEKMDALESKVDEQLKVFDKENGLDKLEGISAEELEDRENDWYDIAKDIVKDGETNDILKNLAIQELKVLDETALYQNVIEGAAAQTGRKPEEIKDIYNRGLTGQELSEEENKLFALMEEQRKSMKAKVFADKFADLAQQFEATKAMELAKLSAEDIYPITPEMSEQDRAKALKNREQYIAQWLEKGKTNELEWIEENALRALKKAHKDEKISDDELVNKYRKEFDALTERYASAVALVDDSVKSAFVAKVDLLASRSARITKAPDINDNAKAFLQDFAANHEKTYALGKAAVTIGKTLLVTQGIKYAAGFKGMAVYSAYTTHKAIKKSWEKYKEQARANGKSANLAGFWGYLKENKEERADLIGKVAKTAIMSTLAVAGTVTGIDNIPGVSAALVGATNAATSTAKLIYKLKDFKNKNPKATKWGLIGAGVAALGSAAVAAVHFLPDETKDKIGGFFNSLAEKVGLSKDDGLSDLDKKLVSESDGQGMTDAEQKQMFDNMENLKNGNGDITDPLNMKAGENAADATAGENGATDAAQAAADVPALSEADIKLMVTDCKMGPDPIVAKLESMGVLSQEDKEQLIGAGGRKDGVASRVLASYLGHPYDNTEVPVHANLTPEQQQELNQYLRSSEYQQECNNCNAAANARHLAKVRQMAENQNGDGNAKGFKLEQLSEEEKARLNGANTPKEAPKVGVKVDQNKAVLGVTIKHGVDSNMQQVSTTGDAYIDSKNAALQQHQATGAKHMTTEYTDAQGNTVKGKFTVRDKEDGYKLKGKMEREDGTKIKETTRVEGDSRVSKYKGLTTGDIDGDNQEEKLVGTAQKGNTHYTAIKTSTGQKIIQTTETDGKGNVVSQNTTTVKGNIMSKLKDMVKGKNR